MLLAFLFIQNNSYSQTSVKPKLNWRVANPFEQAVFIENKGQFDNQATGNEKILYKTVISGTDVYITDKGILYSHTEKVKAAQPKGAKDEDERTPLMTVRHYAGFEWKNPNSAMQVIPEGETSTYYTYTDGKKGNILASAFKKLLLHNIFPAIDLEYSFPEGGKSLYCKVIAQPWADTKTISLIYPGLASSKENETATINISHDLGDFTISSNAAQSGLLGLNKRENEIEINAASNTALWITNPAFSGYDAMYDICYDDSGNVYVYGGMGPYQLAKIDNAGNIKWIYNIYFGGKSSGNTFYGDFVTDKHTGTSYIGAAVDYYDGPEILKINRLGILVDTTHLSLNLSEIWRMDMNYCTNQILIGGGGINSMNQTATMDTGLSTLHIYDPLGATESKHDITLLGADKNSPQCFMATAASNTFNGNYDNILMKCALPAMLPPAYMNYDMYAFMEILSNDYVYGLTVNNSNSAANGINGIVATANNVYLWDGGLISGFNKNSGLLINSRSINSVNRGMFNGELVYCGGIDADPCGNIYIGNNAEIDILDSNFNTTNVISLPTSTDTVFDLHITPLGTLYACGYGFVTSYSIPQSVSSINKVTSPACSGCNGTAIVSLSSCGTAEYSWSNGSTGDFVTNLCAGTYTVTARLDCSTVISDTVTILPSANPSVTIPGADVKDITCYNDHNGSAIAIASGGTPPYTYAWYPSNISNDTISNLYPGTYTFVVTDIHGCASIDTVTITQPSVLGVSASGTGPVHLGQVATLTAQASGGTPPYTYVWSDSAGSNSTANVSPGNTITYTVTVTDRNGCTSMAVITVEVLCGDVFVPDIFSPNSDGHNDRLYVRGDCITDMTFMVFDRWGNKIFESDKLTTGWDGYFKGLPMNPGTYVWFLKATLKDGASIQRKGNITLVR